VKVDIEKNMSHQATSTFKSFLFKHSHFLQTVIINFIIIQNALIWCYGIGWTRLMLSFFNEPI